MALLLHTLSRHRISPDVLSTRIRLYIPPSNDPVIGGWNVEFTKSLPISGVRPYRTLHSHLSKYFLCMAH